MLLYKKYNLVFPIKRYSYFLISLREDGRGGRTRTYEMSESKSDALPTWLHPYGGEEII